MVSVLFPTTGRPNMAERALLSLHATANHPIEVIAAVDKDPETCEAIAPYIDRLLIAPFYRGCSQAWNDCLAESSGDPIVFAADDLVFQKGWLQESLDALETFDDGWGMVGFNDGHWDGNELATHYLMSRRFIVDVLGGVVAWPFYEHSFNDLEVNARAKAAGRYVWAEEARVPHVHWLFGDRPKDDTDTRTLGSHAASQQKFNEREAAGFPSDYEPVITA